MGAVRCLAEPVVPVEAVGDLVDGYDAMPIGQLMPFGPWLQ